MTTADGWNEFSHKVIFNGDDVSWTNVKKKQEWYLDIREKVNALGSVIEIITDENKAILDAVKSIETLYEEAEKIDFRPYAKATEALDNTLRLLPDKIWVE